MSPRHHKQMSLPLVTTTLILLKFILNKSAQSRKLVQWCFIEPLLKDARTLFVYVTNMLDGFDTADEAIFLTESIQKQTIMIEFLEKDIRPKYITVSNSDNNKRKKKKHFGFDFDACAHIDELCDKLVEMIRAYGQSRQSHNKGQDERTIEK